MSLNFVQFVFLITYKTFSVDEKFKNHPFILGIRAHRMNNKAWFIMFN